MALTKKGTGKVWVKLLTQLVFADRSELKIGQVIALDEKSAERLTRRGAAEYCDPPEKPAETPRVDMSGGGIEQPAKPAKKPVEA